MFARGLECFFGGDLRLLALIQTRKCSAVPPSVPAHFRPSHRHGRVHSPLKDAVGKTKPLPYVEGAKTLMIVWASRVTAFCSTKLPMRSSTPFAKSLGISGTNDAGIPANRDRRVMLVTARTRWAGLLRPRQSQTAYRLCAARDFGALEQIIALKFLGLSLRKVRGVLVRSDLELRYALRP